MKEKLHSLVDLLSVPPEIVNFADKNKRRWSAYQADLNNDTGTSVFVDQAFTYHEYLLNFGVLANHLRDRFSAPVVCTLDNRLDRSAVRVVDSYGYDSVVYLNERLYHPVTIAHSIQSAVRLYRSLSTVDELMSVTYRDIHIGDLIYNTYLRETGAVTISEIETNIFRWIFRAVSLVDTFRELLDNTCPEVLLTCDIPYLRSGVPARVAVQQDIDVIAPLRNSGFTRIRSVDELQQGRMQPDTTLFESTFSKYQDALVTAGQRYIRQRMDNEVSDSDANLAYDNTKRTLQQSELYSQPGLNESNPNALVMSHVLTDAVLEGKYQLFQDYYTWLEKTIEHAAEQSDTNWIIKEHPSIGRYNCDVTAADLVNRITAECDSTSIYMLPDAVNTASLVDIADTIITINGTAGMEFASYGIPPILAGDSSYSGFGFTHEPETKAAYFDLLGNIGSLDSLDDVQINRAISMMFYQHVLMAPRSDYVIDWRLYDDQSAVWSDAASRVESISSANDRVADTFIDFIEDEKPHTVHMEDLYVFSPG